MKEFFKSKFNIVLFSTQVLALLALCFSSLNGIFLIISIVMEGVFFVVYGVNCFLANKKMERDNDLYELLPISEEEKKTMSVREKKSKKGNILKGIMFIVFGIMLVFLVVF